MIDVVPGLTELHYTMAMSDADAEHLRYILDAVNFLVFTLSPDYRFSYVNKAAEGGDWLARPREEIEGRTVREALGEREFAMLRPNLDRALLGETVKFESDGLAPNFTAKQRFVTLTPRIDPTTGAVLNILVTAQDITPYKEAENQLRWLAYHDALTRLPNRVLFHENLEVAIAQASQSHMPVALLYIDLNQFKPVNDLYGHDVGDLLLQEVAARFQESLRSEDVVARLGGDEFVILLSSPKSRHAPAQVALRILGALEKPFSLVSRSMAAGANAVKLTANIGISLYPDHGSDAASLLRHADQAMYQARSEGPGGYSIFHHIEKQ